MTGSRAMTPMPSRISRMTGSRSAIGGGGGSGRRIEPRSTADTRNETASMKIASGALSSWMRKPLIPKAVNSAAEPEAASAPLARTSWLRGTIDGRYALSAASKNVLRIATTNDTRSNWARVNQPPTAPIGIVNSRTARPRSAQTMTGRRRSRSTQAPTTRPNRSAASRSIERTSATSNAPAPRTRMATNGKAIRVMSEPKIEIVAADQTRTNAAFDQSGEANGLRTVRAAYERHPGRPRPPVDPASNHPACQPC
jgi:hypothetical protein